MTVRTMRGWNHSEVYRRTLVLMAERIGGGKSVTLRRAPSGAPRRATARDTLIRSSPRNLSPRRRGARISHFADPADCDSVILFYFVVLAEIGRPVRYAFSINKNLLSLESFEH